MTAAHYKKRLGERAPRVVRFPASWLAAAFLGVAAVGAAVFVLLRPMTGASLGAVLLAGALVLGVLLPLGGFIQWAATRRGLLSEAAARWPGKRALIRRAG